MTAAVVEKPRLGQVEELADAIRAKADNPAEAPYWAGFIVGFTAAFANDDVFTDALTDARNVMFAAAYNLPSAQSRVLMLGSNVDQDRRDRILKASGVLFGWKQATSERADAEECLVCEARILTDIDDEAVTTCSSGHFCNDECHRSYDSYRCCQEAGGFDDDTYFARKYEGRL